jgi:anti-anti-sigma factor
MTIAAMFEIEREGATIIFTPAANLRELEDMESNAREVVDLLSDLSIKNLVMDFHKTDYFGSSALAFFMKLWKTVKGRSGCMAFCNLSEHEQEILHVTKLDTLWTICASRAEAMKAVAG